MCQDITKQTYVVLRAFKTATDARDEVTPSEMMKRIISVSEEEFGTDQYAFSPSSLSSLSDGLFESGTIGDRPDGYYGLTTRGEERLASLEQTTLRDRQKVQAKHAQPA